MTQLTEVPADTERDAGEYRLSSMLILPAGAAVPEPCTEDAPEVVPFGGTVVSTPPPEGAGAEFVPVTVMVPVISGCRVHK